MVLSTKTQDSDDDDRATTNSIDANDNGIITQVMNVMHKARRSIYLGLLFIDDYPPSMEPEELLYFDSWQMRMTLGA